MILGPSWSSSFLILICVVSYCVIRVMPYAYYDFCASSPMDGCSFASFLVSRVPIPLSGNVCVLNFVCDWDRGAVVVGTLVGIDSLSPQGLPQRKMARFSISLISIIVLLARPPRLLLNMLLAMQFRVHYCRQYIVSASTSVYTC